MSLSLLQTEPPSLLSPQGNMAFFDTTPTGRVLNRFSRDTDMVDTQVRCVLSRGAVCRPPLLQATLSCFRDGHTFKEVAGCQFACTQPVR